MGVVGPVGGLLGSTEVDHGGSGFVGECEVAGVEGAWGGGGRCFGEKERDGSMMTLAMAA